MKMTKKDDHSVGYFMQKGLLTMRHKVRGPSIGHTTSTLCLALADIHIMHACS